MPQACGILVGCGLLANGITGGAQQFGPPEAVTSSRVVLGPLFEFAGSHAVIRWSLLQFA